MDYTINTKCVQAGYTPGNGEPRQIPIIQSTTYKYDTSEDMGKLFDLEAEGYFYSRLQNPTNDYVAAKITALEGYLWYADFFRTGSKLLRCLQYLRSRQPYRFLLFHLWRNLQPSCSYNEKNGRRRYLR